MRYHPSHYRSLPAYRECPSPLPSRNIPFHSLHPPGFRHRSAHCGTHPTIRGPSAAGSQYPDICTDGMPGATHPRPAMPALRRIAPESGRLSSVLPATSDPASLPHLRHPFVCFHCLYPLSPVFLLLHIPADWQNRYPASEALSDTSAPAHFPERPFPEPVPPAHYMRYRPAPPS